MRIAFFSWESLHSISIGGVAVHVSKLADALVRKGHDVHVFTRQAYGQNTYECIDGVHYHLCSFELSNHFITEIKNMCRSFVQAFFETEDFGGSFDIVHAHDWLTAYALLWIKESRSRKTIFTIHSTEYGRCGNNFVDGDSEEIRHIEWLASYHADKVISVSNTLKDEMNQLYNLPLSKVDVVYNGIECCEFDGWIDSLAVKRMYAIGPTNPVILFVGRMVYQKGPDLLVESIPQVLSHFPDAKLIFAGDGGMRLHIEDLASKMKINNATRFLGQLNGWRLNDLFKMADVICVPSRNEPFGIVILEAWAAGKPVVASVNGGPAEFVWHDINGIKVEADTHSIGQGLITLLADHEHAQWMGRNGRLSAEKIFSWNRIADETLFSYCH